VELLAFWRANLPELLVMLGQHLFLVVLSITVAIAIGVPAGILAVHRPSIGRPLLAVANVAQTIPSLALLGFLIPIPVIGGIGPRAAIVALILYGLLPIVRSTAAGLRSIDAAVLEAGEAMGMTARQRLRLVELPLALPSIVAGVRVATVIAVGTATIAAAIGAGGLGEYIFRGLSMVNGTVILAGASPAALLALTADGLLGGLERRLSHNPSASRSVAAVAALVVTLLLVAIVAARPAGTERVVIGSKNFTEQVILGELLAQAIEREGGLTVERRLNLGGTFICDQAVRSGDIDVYVEYTGTALTAILRDSVSRDRDAVLARVRERYAEQGLAVAAPLGFNNTFAMLVRGGDARQLGLRTIGDLRRVQDTWQPGFGHEFVEREDGYRGLVDAYSLQFARQPRTMEPSLIYPALSGGQVDVIAGDATSPQIEALDLVMLADDRSYFPPYDAVPIVRTSSLLRHEALRRALDRIAGTVSEADMRAMNHAVDVLRQDVPAVVREFLSR
jgi:osmoprotectant transport system permease protein